MSYTTSADTFYTHARLTISLWSYKKHHSSNSVFFTTPIFKIFFFYVFGSASVAIKKYYLYNSSIRTLTRFITLNGVWIIVLPIVFLFFLYAAKKRDVLIIWYRLRARGQTETDYFNRVSLMNGRIKTKLNYGCIIYWLLIMCYRVNVT